MTLFQTIINQLFGTKIEVTRSDCNEGARRHAGMNPIALAAKRTINEDVFVRGYAITTKRGHIELPLRARLATHVFNWMGLMVPFSFRIKL